MGKEFEKIIQAAKDGDEKAIIDILKIVNPIVEKNSYINGKLDEDLYQNIVFKILELISKFEM